MPALGDAGKALSQNILCENVECGDRWSSPGGSAAVVCTREIMLTECFLATSKTSENRYCPVSVGTFIVIYCIRPGLNGRPLIKWVVISTFG